MSANNCYNLPYKSVVWSLVLSLLLGPLGLIYTNWIASLVLFILVIITMLLGKTGTFILAVLWMISVYWNVINVEKYNRRLVNKLMTSATSE